MRDKDFGNLNLIAHDFFLLIGILFSAAIAAHLELLGQHGESAKGVGLSEQDFVLIAGIALVMDSMVLADNNPEVIGDVFHDSALQVPNGASFWYTLGPSRVGVCKEIVNGNNRKYINKKRQPKARQIASQSTSSVTLSPDFLTETNPAWTIGRTFRRHSMRL